jgi:ABC-type transporter Mla MlaB component
MAEPKDTDSFFRKVVRFVANPTTEWSELHSRQDDVREQELEKSELKAMVERKRRNDFVRKREFDMLRKVRREGLTPEQLAALGTSSRLDDSEARMSESALRQDSGVKAKIDDIEREMVGESASMRGNTRPSGFFGAPATTSGAAARHVSSNTRQGALDATPRTPPGTNRSYASDDVDDGDELPALPPLEELDPSPMAAPAAPPSAHSFAVMAPGLGPLAPVSLDAPIRSEHGALPFDVEVEVNELVHDPELDEAVIAFANADFAACERTLQQLVGPGGARAQHAETWLALFDLYRATGQQQRFESLALDYAQQFGWSAPQWFSLPKLVADALADERPRPARLSGDVGWICPEVLDSEAVARLRSQTLQLPLPWVLDWSNVSRVEPEAAMQLSAVLRLWAGQALEMQWIGGDRLFSVLAEAAPTGVRDADPAFWLVRLDALRLANRADQFDETAIDYCVTYEVSPPSWEATRCNVRISGGGGHSTRAPSLSVVSDVTTTFMESSLLDDARSVQVATVELSGQLTGDISATLARLDTELHTAPVVNVSCARLIRVDFVAAGDLLNWVMAKRQENRAVQFSEAHRLVALFFGAMGINEQAKVLVRRV